VVRLIVCVLSSELPTEDELIESKLEKLRFPSPEAVSEYWDLFLVLLDPKSQELWDAALFCFEQYGKLLTGKEPELYRT
jgi:hypothetical protein